MRNYMTVGLASNMAAGRGWVKSLLSLLAAAGIVWFGYVPASVYALKGLLTIHNWIYPGNNGDVLAAAFLAGAIGLVVVIWLQLLADKLVLAFTKWIGWKLLKR